MAINWVDHMLKQFQTRKLFFWSFRAHHVPFQSPTGLECYICYSWCPAAFHDCSTRSICLGIEITELNGWDVSSGVLQILQFRIHETQWDTAIWLPSDCHLICLIYQVFIWHTIWYIWYTNIYFYCIFSPAWPTLRLTRQWTLPLGYIDIKIIWYVHGPYKGSRGVPPLDLTQRPGPQPQISWAIPGRRRLEPLTGRGYTMLHQIYCYLLLVVNYYIIMVNYCYMLYGYIWLIFLTVCQIWLTPKRVDFPAGIAARWESLVLFPAGIATSGNADLWNLMKWWWSDDEGHQELGVNSLWITMDK